jgi:glucose-1-phosphate cytidylyltransferase
MKCVILAGGKGTRIAEESSSRPKPMVEIGGLPILWHIMKLYSHHGVSDFVVCLGYKGYLIKEYFANYYLHNADVTFDMRDNKVHYHRTRGDNWRVTLIDTGEETMTGGRLKRTRSHLDANEPFCLTYGDGLADIDVTAEIAFHRAHGKKATIACVHPPARFGRITLKDQKVTSFEEKPLTDGGLINGGYFILQPSVIDYIADDHTIWERDPLERLAAEGELAGWVHNGYWQPMDTLRDKLSLNEKWDSGNAPWKVWS